jgi:hypothetical protein
MKKNARFLPLKVLVGLVACLCAAWAQADAPAPRIAPIHSKPAGQTYGRWAADWWEWALGIPAAVNPLTDTTGEHCAQRQVDEVWFLADWRPPTPVARACKLPAGKSLFFPLIFNVQFPPGNIFAVDESVVPELVLSPTAEQGYYLFVRPLHPGPHTIRWTASGCTPGFSQDITYHLTVVSGGSSD